ncbi:MAG TPA: hypothetical protein VNV43_08385 [Candidatus Acidoferrales bacterium]|nr:hypothetical protein [Candidatus Acidoferrales bacterium]
MSSDRPTWERLHFQPNGGQVLLLYDFNNVHVDIAWPATLV